ncbi:histidine kinase [Ramlibacter sp. PS3R-8]|uniref:sensor histidine kinase n=1 Tax=Ramlibacter sp. PS3R-8 TaxID=3133437 RepID=UPI00309AA4F3
MRALSAPVLPLSDASENLWRGTPARGAVAMAGLLAIAAPLRFFIGALSVMQQPSVPDMVELAAWWLLYAAVFWLALLAAGHAGARLVAGLDRIARAALWLALACACAAAANLAAAGRSRILIEQGVVQGALPMHLYGFALSFTLAILYFALLRRSRLHEEAATRLAAAQAAQREARRRRVQIDLQAVQARIDPSLLFGMLDAVRQAYACDPPRAERLLDELIAFLRASLPRLPSDTSSVPREAELARAYAQLLSLAQAATWGMSVDVSEPARHARFPPGALLPLVDDALRSRGGPCTLQATCKGGVCRVTLGLPARPSETTIARVRSLLHEIDGSAAGLSVTTEAGAAQVEMWVPHESS